MSRTQQLTITQLEDRTTPAVAAAYAVGVLAGQTGDVVVYTADGTSDYRVATPYGADFTGGVRVALADVTGDGTADLITVPGAGTAATVKVYDGADPAHALVASFTAFESSFTGGAYVASADITGDGFAEVVVGADLGGGPRVAVFDGSTVTGGTTAPTTLADFLAIDDSNFRGGVRLALGDISGDGVADLLVGAGFGGGPRVAAFDGASLAQGQQVKLFNDLFAFEGALRNGAFVSVGDVNGDGCGDLVFGAGPGGGPRIRALDGKAALEGRESELASFFAGDSSSREGVEPGVLADEDGTVSVVGTDVATGAVGMFGLDGSRRDGAGAPRGGFGAPPFEGSPVTVADAAAVADAVTGTYTGTAAGVLSTLSTTGGAPTSTDEEVTVSLDVTSVTPVMPATSDGGAADIPLRLLTLTGTITVTVGDADPVTFAFTGTLRLAGGTADEPRGRVSLTADRSAATGATGFTLNGVLNDRTLTASWLVVSDHSNPPGGYVFQYRPVRTAEPLALARA
jgi:hypothetical protein